MICEITKEDCNEVIVTERYCMYCLVKKIYVMLNKQNELKKETKVETKEEIKRETKGKLKGK